ncbi:hypothetical protein KR018_002361, partial [Drosophila ironensis]
MWPKSPRIRQSNSSLTASSPKGSPRALYTKSKIPGQLNKRRTFGTRTQQKQNGSANKENCSKMLNKIPKAVLLTPSSSDNSLSTTTSSSGCPKYTVAPKTNICKQPTSPVAPYLTLKRQQTASMMSFRVRKSLSQMDFKEARRTGNYKVVAHVASPGKTVPEPQNTVAVELQGNVTKLMLEDTALICGPGGDGQMSFVVGPEQDARVASLRIFNTIMLHAWRKRREEVRNLSGQVEDYKKSVVKNRNQLHVYNTLFSVEKRRNDTLNDQLRQSYRENAQTKLSYEELSLMLVQAKSEKEKLAEELVAKNQDMEKLAEELEGKNQDIKNLQEIQDSLKTELFRANNVQRKQLEQFTQLQREFLDSQCALEEMKQQVELLHIDLAIKRDFIDQLRDNSAELEEDKLATEKQYKKLLEETSELERCLQEKEEKLVTLQNCLAATLGQRIRQCLAQGQFYQNATCRMLHFVAHYMLPGTPPPTPPIIPGAVHTLRGLFSR